MDKEYAIEILSDYIKAVQEAGYKVEAVYLFGSFVKGTAQQDSDIDVALFIDGLKNSFDTQVELMKLRRKVDLRIEPHPFSVSDTMDDSILVQEILKTGIRVA
ncbi:MAG: nucleotidyltransferase domain-containing protein [Treponema sp.]|nr:nucleotidyltransferase domain-containing protein [Treponema sp.]